MADLSTSIAGVKLPNLFFNASGVCCQHEEELKTLLDSESGSLITKSATYEKRLGNPSPRYVPLPGLGSINSMGLPNEGYEYYLEYAKKYDYTHEKPLFISLSGLCLEDNVKMVEAFVTADLPCILEVNFSCPNVPGKPQLGYDLEAMENALNVLAPLIKKPFGIKLPPYFDIAHFDAAAAIFNKFDNLSFVTCINSVGNGLAIDFETETALIKPKDGFGGLGGTMVLHTALANVNAFYRRLPNKKVIGVGGVTSGKEAFLHVLAGASAVQIGTQLKEEGPQMFSRIKKELEDIMIAKGYKSLDDFRGKVKTL
ncbi:Dihydroorotate dehydrogenase [Radiomyces spectabilis]|uniref:Dihydroorotate dehydrogenase n=1 Tax=Radiomyces spectabilis TaxID=64574 RepID=UPI0022203A05|nr:Dihydroorotate dehydrogenase [Radiomyces spectabilis]KAI8391571.1 Dihydroorotate dehydrogenase [Radiomyces spectabilis]